MTKRAQPIKQKSKWVCSNCQVPCYFDGRCGDGPILTCSCNEVEDSYWDQWEEKK